MALTLGYTLGFAGGLETASSPRMMLSRFFVWSTMGTTPCELAHQTLYSTSGIADDPLKTPSKCGIWHSGVIAAIPERISRHALQDCLQPAVQGGAELALPGASPFKSVPQSCCALCITYYSELLTLLQPSKHLWSFCIDL